MPRFNAEGMRFGRLIAEKRFVKERKLKNGKCGNRTFYHCKCDCGNFVDVEAYHLIHGHTKSCGCYKIEATKKANTTHGETNTRLYRIWAAMRRRCYYSKDIGYKDYGGRGIKVCEPWRKSYELFRDWALNNGYTEKLTLDRIDVNGDYYPENCRFITLTEQCRNRRITIMVEYNGERKSLIEFAKEYNIKYRTLYDRYVTKKLPIDVCLTTPVKKKVATEKQ